MKGSTWSAMAPLVATLAACSFAPTYRTPDSAPPAPVYKETGDWQQAGPLDNQARGAWWTLFQDPQLDALEAQVGSSNQNLKAAFARLQEARAATRIARADLFPAVNLGASATRARTSVNSPRFPTGEEPTLNNFDLEADLSYEIDIWGRVRNTVNAAHANQQASAGDLASLDLALHAELATDYYTLRAQDAEQVLLERTVEDYSKSLQLTAAVVPKRRGRRGRRRSSTGTARDGADAGGRHCPRTCPNRARDRRADRREPFRFPPRFESLGDRYRAAADRSWLAVDVAGASPGCGGSRTASRRRQRANRGCLRAAFFPVFSLTGAAGFDSTKASAWLNAPSRMWSLGPTGLLTLFDAGRHSAQAAQAHAQYDEQVADYRNAVLMAYREVEDNLAALHRLEQESISESAAVTATGKGARTSPIPVQGGPGHVSRGGGDHGDHRPAGAIVTRQHPEPGHECQRVTGQSTRRRVARREMPPGRIDASARGRYRSSPVGNQPAEFVMSVEEYGGSMTVDACSDGWSADVCAVG